MVMHGSDKVDKDGTVMNFPSRRVSEQASKLDLPGIGTCDGETNQNKCVRRVSRIMGFIGERINVTQCHGAPYGLPTRMGPKPRHLVTWGPGVAPWPLPALSGIFLTWKK